MSYYATFKPTEEAMANFKPWTDEQKVNQWINDARNEIMVKCMTGNNGKDVMKTSGELRFILTQLASYSDHLSRIGSYNQYQEDKSVWFCGWKYARENNNPDMEVVEGRVLRELLLLTHVVETPDFFEKEEEFYEKVNRISEELDYFIESAQESADFKIMHELKDFRVGEDDDVEEKEADSQDSTEEQPHTDGCVSNQTTTFDATDGTMQYNYAVSGESQQQAEPIAEEPKNEPSQIPTWFGQNAEWNSGN